MTEAEDPNQQYLVIARIVSPQGNRGEVKAELVTDFPERFASTRTVHIGDDHRVYALESYRLLERVIVMKLEGVNSIGEAEGLRGQLVEIPESEAVALPAGHYFWHQIVGLRVVTSSGEEIGVVDDILATGANDVYVVHGPSGEQLIPAIKQVVKSINLATGTITIDPMEWTQ